jgi:hypothetical protein
MAFWNSRDDDDEAVETAADELESAATGLPPAGQAAAADEPRNGFNAAPIGLIAAAAVILLALFFLAPSLGPLSGPAEPWVPRGEAVCASQRLADIAAEQRIADARAVAWEDVPAVDAHVGTFAAQTPPR